MNSELRTPNFQPIIGMEVHVELKTASKMFCACPNNPDEKEPNTHICPICTAQPGTLPMPNKQAVIWTVLIGTALGCRIRDVSKFDRKHYFYPDLPKGYQISQYDEPIAEDGSMTLFLPLEDNIRDTAVIGIERVHLEEDTAKLIHSIPKNFPPLVGEGEGGVSTLVDFNRAGVPLVEIVTKPDIKTALEAKIYSQELQRVMRTLGVSDADMEKGHMRCEANISVQEAGRFEIADGAVKPLGDYVLNPKVEIKNINSFRAVEKAIQFEIARQTTMIEADEPWVQQTRGWDEKKQETVLQRTKENAADYRYFPDPDIPPFHPNMLPIPPLPELPQTKRARFHREYGFSYADALLLTDSPAWSAFAEDVMSELYDWLHHLPETANMIDETIVAKKTELAQLAGGWMTSKLMGILNEKQMDIAGVAFSPENFAELLALVYTERINATNAHKILLIMVELDTNIDPTHIMEEKGFGQISDAQLLGDVIATVIADHPKQVAEYRAGKQAVLQFLIGMVMKATEGSANPKIVEVLMKQKLS